MRDGRPASARNAGASAEKCHGFTEEERGAMKERTRELKGPRALWPKKPGTALGRLPAFQRNGPSGVGYRRSGAG
jgi:hypothetical protein